MQHNGYRFVMWDLSGSDQSVSCEDKNVKHIKDDNNEYGEVPHTPDLKSIGVCQCPIDVLSQLWKYLLSFDMFYLEG